MGNRGLDARRDPRQSLGITSLVRGRKKIRRIMSRNKTRPLKAERHVRLAAATGLRIKTTGGMAGREGGNDGESVGKNSTVGERYSGRTLSMRRYIGLSGRGRTRKRS